MANTAKKIDKLNTRILELEKEMRDALTKKKNGSAEISISATQKKIDDARKAVNDLRKK